MSLTFLINQRLKGQYIPYTVEAEGGFYEGYSDRTFSKSFRPDIISFADFGRSYARGHKLGVSQ
jgi:hypothetical protein